jgi:hypothetical protein
MNSSVKIRKTKRFVSVFERLQYQKFIKEYPEYSNKINSVTEFKRLLLLVQEEIIKELQRNPYGVILPENFAVIFLNNCGENKKQAIDFAASKKYNKRIFHLNFGTENNLMKIMYLNKILPTNVENNELYSFYPKKSFKKKCSDWFKDNWTNCLTYKR